MLNTKIICTIGPASESLEMLKELSDSGMNVVRLNFSHGTHQAHQKITERICKLNETRKYPIGILLDTQGPEIRTGEGEMELIEGAEVIIRTPPDDEIDGQIYVNYPHLKSDLEVGKYIALDSGLMRLKVSEITKKGIHCEVIDGGLLKSRRHVNLPGSIVKLPGITDQDQRDIYFGLEQNVDMIALSFVRSADTIRQVRKLLGPQKKHIMLIAKIENQEGLDRLEEIIQEADGAMVARGDLGIEIDMEELPQVQRRIGYLCAKHGKRVIVATQMLESMIENPVPTRAEVTDVANAVYEQADAIMLSGETSVGKYPVRCVETLVRIARRTEHFPGVNYSKKLIMLRKGEYIAYSAMQVAEVLKIRAVVVITRNGRGARYLSNQRAKGIDIFAFTNNKKVQSACTLFRGVIPLMMEYQDDPENSFLHALQILKEQENFESGEQIILFANLLTSEGYCPSFQIRTSPS